VLGVVPRTKSKEDADEEPDDEVLDAVDDEWLDDVDGVNCAEVVVEVEEDDDVVDRLDGVVVELLA
jgi:hypothetical protein